MEILSDTETALVVRHTTARSELLWFVGAVALIACVAPRVNGAAGVLSGPLALGGVAGLAWAVYASRCFEVYRFERFTGRFAIERHSPFGRSSREGPLSQIQDVRMETGGYENDRALVTLVLTEGCERIPLPRRITSFSGPEQRALAERLARFLDLSPAGSSALPGRPTYPCG